MDIGEYIQIQIPLKTFRKAFRGRFSRKVWMTLHGLAHYCPSFVLFDRALEPRHLEHLQKRVEQLVPTLALGFGCNASVDWRLNEQPLYPPTVNDARTAEFARNVAAECVRLLQLLDWRGSSPCCSPILNSSPSPLFSACLDLIKSLKQSH